MEQLTSADGTTIALDRLGSGPPLVLVGGATVTRRLIEPTAQALAHHFTVFNYDRRGRADTTDALRGTGDTRAVMEQVVERETQDLAAVVAAAGEPAVILGFSSGGAVAINAVASDVPARALVLWEVPYSTSPDAASSTAEYVNTLARLLDSQDADGALGHFFTKVGVPADALAGMRQSPFWAAGESLAPTLAYDAAALGDTTVPEGLLRGLDVPTLVLAGGSEASEAFRSAATVVAQSIPDATYEVLAGQEHNVDPDVLSDAVVSFLAGR